MYCSVNPLPPIVKSTSVCGSKLYAENAVPTPSIAMTVNFTCLYFLAGTCRLRFSANHWIPPIMESSTTAMIAAAIDPTVTEIRLLVCNPVKIKFPKLVAPTKVESVASPTVQTAAVRIPEIITGSASGRRTLVRI